MKLNNLEDAIKVNKKYDLIYADPPWLYNDRKGCNPAMGGITYDVMSLDEIKNLGKVINQITNKDCALFLWVTIPMLQEGLEVINAWGFQYKTCAFNWIKLNPSIKISGPYGTGDTGVDIIKNTDIYSGLGHWVNGNAELCLFAKKGHPKRAEKDIKQILLAPRGKHSSKPIEARNRIDKLIVAKNKLELFCRGTGGSGWDVWGNEAE